MKGAQDEIVLAVIKTMGCTAARNALTITRHDSNHSKRTVAKMSGADNRAGDRSNLW
jgi:hypothetical protein